MFEKTRMMQLFLWGIGDVCSYILNYQSENVSGCQPLGEGWGRQGLIFFVSQDPSVPARPFTIHFGLRRWITHRLVPPSSSWLLPVHMTPQLRKRKHIWLPWWAHNQVKSMLFPLLPYHQKSSSLTFSKIHKINIFLGSQLPFLPNNNYIINNKPQSS